MTETIMPNGDRFTHDPVTHERVWFPANGPAWVSRNFGPWEALTPPEPVQEALL